MSSKMTIFFLNPATDIKDLENKMAILEKNMEKSKISATAATLLMSGAALYLQ